MNAAGMSESEMIILRKTPELKENQQISLKLQSTLEINILSRMEEKLLGFLRHELDNSNIKVIYELEEVEESDRLYTDTDKFNHLAKKNPALLKLKDTFGLDPEY